MRGSADEKFHGQIGHGNRKDYRYYYSKELNQRINAFELEDLIEKRVIKYFNNSGLFKKLVASGFNHRDTKVETLKKEILSSRLKLKRMEMNIRNLINHMANPALNSSAVETIAKQLNEFEPDKATIVGSIKKNSDLIATLMSLKEVTSAEDKIEKYASEFKNFSRIQKRELLGVIFEKVEVMNPYLVKLHLKRHPSLGDFRGVLKKSCGSGKSGGTSRT